MEKKRYESLDGLRSFACIGIIMLHVLENVEYHVNGFLFDEMIPEFTSFVYLFMAISGFGMCCGYYEKFIGGNVNIVSFYQKRYAKLLPFFSLLCFIDFAMSPSANSFYEVITNLTLCFGLIPNANISVIGVGWFLGVVFAFYFLFPFYCSLLSNKVKAWETFIVSLIINRISINYFGVGMKSIVFCFAFFVVGGLIYLYRKELDNNSSIKWFSFILAFFLTLVYFFYCKNEIVIAFFDAAIIVFAINFEGMSFLNNKITKFIGGISFEIYLSHMLILRCVEKAHMLKLTTNDYINYCITVVIVFMGAIVFAIYGKKMIEIIDKTRIKIMK